MPPTRLSLIDTYPSTGNQPLEAEEQQQQKAQPECRDGQEQGRRSHQRKIGQAVLFPGSDHTRRYRNQAGEQHGNHDDLGADEKARDDQRQHRLVVDDGPAEIPCTTLPAQMTNCCGMDLSRPSSVLIASICSGCAISPSIRAAGSPGMKRMSAKTVIDTNAIVGSAIKRRLSMNLIIGSPRLMAGNDIPPLSVSLLVTMTD